MPSNIDRFKSDMDRLIAEGELLSYAMINHADKNNFRLQVEEQLKDEEKIKDFFEKLPNFHIKYEEWYSESLALLKQILPDRVSNFVSFYEKPKNRKDISYDNYVIQDFLTGLTVTIGATIKVNASAAIPKFKQQLAIVKATKIRFSSSLFEIKQILQADLFDSEIATARELLKKGFLRAAGAVTGVILEKHLGQVCADHNIVVAKKHPGINDFNELLKNNSVVDISQWRYVSLLGDYRNLCDHNKGVEPTGGQIKDLIDGTDKVIKTIH